ncbi:MAG: GNAT family N-acetyltransferase [Verrucomicrobia bacterium]|nr:GNAT family N-acetyltransferase [Verrucomicrobiota bacterium]
MADAIQTRIHEGRSGALPELREVWRDCLPRCPPEQQLFSFEWFDCWTRTYGTRPPWIGRTHVITAHLPDGTTVAVLPLAERRSQGLTWLSLAGFYQPLRSFPAVPEHAAATGAALTRALLRDLRGWDVLRFGPWDNASPERAALMQALATQAHHRLVIPRGRTIVNRIEPTFDPYAASKSIKRIESYSRRFLREPGAEINHVSNPDVTSADALFRNLGAIEERSWLAREGGDLRFATDADRAFWTRVTERALTPGGQLDVWIASLGGKPLGFRVVLSSGPASYMIANQFDEQAGEFRLGWVLYLHHLREAVARGTRLIDSAPDDLHYKSRLGGEEAEMREDLICFRNSLKGLALSRALRGLQASKAWLGARPGFARRLADRLPRI